MWPGQRISPPDTSVREAAIRRPKMCSGRSWLCGSDFWAMSTRTRLPPEAKSRGCSGGRAFSRGRDAVPAGSGRAGAGPGGRHPDTLSTRSAVAWNLGERGRFEEAEALYRQVLEVTNRVLGEVHPN